MCLCKHYNCRFYWFLYICTTFWYSFVIFYSYASSYNNNSNDAFMHEDSQSFIDVFVDIDRIRLSKGRFSYVGPWSFCMVIPLVVCLAPPCFVHFIIQVLAASMRIVPAGYSFQLSRLISQWPNTLIFIANIFSSAKRKIANYWMIDYNELFFIFVTYIRYYNVCYIRIVCIS